MIGDILAKMGRGEPLSREEQETIRLWGNQAENTGSFLAGLQNGSSGLNVSYINTKKINDEVIARNVRIWRSTDQTISNGTITPISFDTKLEDKDSFADLATSPTKITIPVGMSGKYIVGFLVAFYLISLAGAGIPYVQAWIRKNGDLALVDDDEYSANNIGQTCLGTTVVNLVAGDYIELIAYQLTGSDLDVLSYTQFSPVLWMSKIF